ncbi:P-loop containing nucleoside triphosphate hydrolase protein [Tribonema minus]|uniref:P-loop containing nucleoside triphosphate hydrolase protein n=1 Tax=Tribonema minus TaxID=303371 RepID=A0A835YLN8_9STRA|nr:P-loop containing nucleoside triphosphate hydrolase protein [Tribonema minus]
MRKGGAGLRGAASASALLLPSSEDSGAGGEPSKECPILVAVRVRPRNEKELASGDPPCVRVLSRSHLCISKNEGVNQYLNSQRGRVNDYEFDVVFDETATQAEVYQRSTQPRVASVLDGYSLTVFAYGATGSGKTHSMFVLTLPLLLYCGTAQVYNDRLYDLLSPGDGAPLRIREDARRGVTEVAGLTRRRVSSAAEALECISEGNHNRRVGSTAHNSVSSRSHAILQVHVRSDGVQECSAVMSLVDLAGSERAGAAAKDRQRLTEASHINQSLLALGNCINALSGEGDAQCQAKYRDSKLTHLLKGSLEGHCSVVMIVAVAPCSGTYEDSHNALKYANRAKEIRVKSPSKRRVDVEM